MATMINNDQNTTRKSDPRTLRLCHLAASFAEMRFYGGFICKTDSGVSLAMYPRDNNRKARLYADSMTLGEHFEHVMNLAKKTWRMDPDTMNAYLQTVEVESTDEYFAMHPTWHDVERYMP